MAENNSKDSLKNDALEVNQHFLKQGTARNLGVNTEKPKFPQYAVVSKRTDSYKNWPKKDVAKIDLNVLVDAGLVYTGVGDSVRCYHCGGGLRNWEINDDPWEEHAKWYQTCPHVRLVKGQDYIDRVGRGEKPDQDGPVVKKKNESKLTDYQLLKSVPAQSCLDCGYKEAIVLKAIKLFMKNNEGNTEFKATDILQIVLELEEEGDVEQDGAVGGETAVFNCCSNTDCTGTCGGVEEDDPAEVEKLYQENQRLKENQMCKICLDDVANVIFLPCGHMVSCPRCAPALIKCPLCRLPISGTVKAYFE